MGVGVQLMNRNILGGTRPTIIKEHDTRVITIRCLNCWTKFEGLACSACGGLRRGLLWMRPDYDGSYAVVAAIFKRKLNPDKPNLQASPDGAIMDQIAETVMSMESPNFDPHLFLLLHSIFRNASADPRSLIMWHSCPRRN